MKTASPFTAARGFTLVEICLAIGVVSFAFVGLLALLPAGMTTFRTAMNTSIGSQIAQRVIDEARQTDFEHLIEGAAAGSVRELTPVRYFDDEGNEVAESDAARSIYHVRRVVRTATPLPGNVRTMPDLATLVVQIAVNPGQKTLAPGESELWLSEVQLPVRNHTALIARNH